ncbi:MAG: hypothetical protein AAF676_03570 [Pseudomonadota bacterium]
MKPRAARRIARRALADLVELRPAPKPVGWNAAVGPRKALPWLLPGALGRHPPVAIGLGLADPLTPERLDAALAQIRAKTLWWPACRADAREVETLVDLRGVAPADQHALLDLAMAAPGASVAALAAAGPEQEAARARGLEALPGPEAARPQALRRVIGAADAALPRHAAIGGVEALAPDGPADPWPWLRRLRFLDPWRRRPTPLAEGLEALAFLREAAERNGRQAVTVGLSAWKRRNAAPFLVGPAGPPIHRATLDRAVRAARRRGGRVALWGTKTGPEGEALETVRLEDGFVRSVGLGLRHAPPASLAVDQEALYFDATRPTDFELLALRADFDARLLGRAAALRRRLVELKITKYNLARSAPLPQPDRARRRVLVPGQVEGDASLRLGSPELRTNAELLRRARARHPDGYLIYKPHPDVLTGLRKGAVPDDVLALADAVVTEASAAACLDWADQVETMTSLMGFEALLRGRAAAVHGRPFYAGWGLTESAGAPFDRGRALTLDQLVAVALILYPRYIDPATRLPAPPERVLEWLHEERAFVRTPRGRAREAWRGLASRALNVVR